MPNWTTHLGGAYIVARPWGKRDLRFFLLGSILPDFIARIEALNLDMFDVNLFHNYSMGAFHTPFMSLLISLIIAQFSNNAKKTCLLIFAGSLFHFFMDMLETKVSHFGTYLLYPFSYRNFQLNVFPRIGPWVYLSWAVCLCILLYAVWEKKQNITVFKPCAYWPVVIGLTVVVLVLPYATNSSFEAHNAGFIQFIKHPNKFEGQKISLHVSQVVSEDPATIKEHRREFPIILGQNIKLKKGEWISLEGVYKKGKIYIDRIQGELGVTTKSLLSLPALLLFPIVWWDWRSLRNRNLGKNRYHKDLPL